MRTVNNSNQQDRPGDDPRIDSPDIKVIYPAQTKELVVSRPMEKEVESSETVVSTVSKEDEKHECKIGFQEAVKQNLVPLLGVGTALLLIGILIGKR